jgi:hypothetical protein
MVSNTAGALREIRLRAAEGDETAFSPAIRLLHEMNEAFRPARDEQRGYGLSGPQLPRFTRPGDQPSPPGAQAPEGEPPPTVVDSEGRPYVEAE